ncbi:hypothetical protein FHS39_003808 [Streptomyces olivoverticillatus]|uniref:DUF6879 domain-containing protein n=1 Tax=Streptomyces olivoverticillatus TaxID=66427 RepID=A0A7W7LQU5_9ACTN|nr:hypothetical protein [Streptomyces olivoverticillatus]
MSVPGFDDRLVRFSHFTGDGASTGGEMLDDPAVVKLCASAFEAVWERATPHEDWRLPLPDAPPTG